MSASLRSGGSNDANAPKGNPWDALVALARRCAIPRCSAHSTPLRASVVLPTPAGPVITAPRLAATAPVNWESSLRRPTIGHPVTPEGTWARSLHQGFRSLFRARDLHFCARIPTVVVSRSSGLLAPGPSVTDGTGQ